MSKQGQEPENSGPARKAKSEIDIPSIVCACFGNEVTKVIVKEVSYKGDGNFNLFSVGRCLIISWKVSGDADCVLLSKNGVETRFDIVIWAKKGVLCCCMMRRSQDFETAAAATKGSKQMSMAKAHHLLGHTNRHTTINTAKHLGWSKLKDSGKICQPCAEVKAKQKLVPQARRAPRLTILKERLYHELAAVQAPADVVEKVSKPNWQIIVDEATGMKFSSFHLTTRALD